MCLPPEEIDEACNGGIALYRDHGTMVSPGYDNVIHAERVLPAVASCIWDITAPYDKVGEI